MDALTTFMTDDHASVCVVRGEAAQGLRQALREAVAIRSAEAGVRINR
jgi:hypothetical protein